MTGLDLFSDLQILPKLFYYIDSFLRFKERKPYCQVGNDGRFYVRSDRPSTFSKDYQDFGGMKKQHGPEHRRKEDCPDGKIKLFFYTHT